VPVVECENRGLLLRFDRQDIGHGVVPGQKDVKGAKTANSGAPSLSSLV
jgi:hypothetical protein